MITATSTVSEIVRSSAVDSADRSRMFTLMDKYFADVTRQGFDHDLVTKPWVIILRNSESGEITGFSSLDVMHSCTGGQNIHAIYSGDTIEDRAIWGTQELSRAFAHFIVQCHGKEPDGRWFWFFVSKGYRTYRFLPVHFLTYYPNRTCETPAFETAVLNELARARFGQFYDPSSGLVRVPADYRLREGVSDLSPALLRDPDVAFFVQRNPDWQKGNELACLTELSTANFRRRVRRWTQNRAR